MAVKGPSHLRLVPKPPASTRAPYPETPRGIRIYRVGGLWRLGIEQGGRTVEVTLDREQLAELLFRVAEAVNQR